MKYLYSFCFLLLLSFSMLSQVNTCNTSYICDGSNQYGNATFPPDCEDGSDELLAYCCVNPNNYFAYYSHPAGIAACENYMSVINTCDAQESYVCDGSNVLGNANWPPDCTDGSDEYLSHCCINASIYTAYSENPAGIAACDAYFNDGDITFGCTDSSACNYDPDATLDDDNCEYTSCIGCTDENACNYDPTALIPNLDACIYIFDECGVCGGDNSSCGGCTDPNAVNYDPSVTIDDGSCDLSGCGLENAEEIKVIALAFSDSQTEYANPWSSYYQLPSALNYHPQNPLNLLDPGKYVRFKFRAENNLSSGSNLVGAQCEITSNDEYVQITDGTAGLNNVAWEDSDWSLDEFELFISPQTPDGHIIYLTFTVTQFDNSWSTYCVGIPIRPVIVSNMNIDDDTNPDSYGNGNGIVEQNEIIEALPIAENLSSFSIYPLAGTFSSSNACVDVWNNDLGVSGNVVSTSWWNYQFGEPQSIEPGATNLVSEFDFVFDYSCNENPFELSVIFSAGFDILSSSFYKTLIKFSSPTGYNGWEEFPDVCGDPDACNYNSTGIINNDLCTYPGCDNMSACNYDETAGCSDGSCEFAEPSYDCNGDCLVDSDGDGVCDENEIPGCTNNSACNYSANATDDDQSCLYVGDACDDGNGNTINDIIQSDCSCSGTDNSSVNDLSQLSILIYPNPVSNILTIDLGILKGLMTSIKLYDSSGRLVFDGQSNSTLILDVSGFAKGMYSLELSTEEQVLRSQVIID